MAVGELMGAFGVAPVPEPELDAIAVPVQLVWGATTSRRRSTSPRRSPAAAGGPSA